jgi:hypothetical protein
MRLQLKNVSAATHAILFILASRPTASGVVYWFISNPLRVDERDNGHLNCVVSTDSETVESIAKY